MDFGFGNLFKLVWLMIPLSLLGIWKLIEIIVWLFSHVKFI